MQINHEVFKVFMCEEETSFLIYEAYVMLCVFWYHLYNLKTVKNTHRGVLLLVKLQASAI